MSGFVHRFWASATFALLAPSSFAETPAANPQTEITTHDAPATFRSGVNLVLVPVVVRDRAGRAIANLQKDDFLLFDRSKPQTISLALSRQYVSVDQAGTGLDAALIEDRTPLIAGNVEVIPSGSSQFHKGEPALFYFELYEPLLINADPAQPPAIAIRERILDRKTAEVKADTGGMRLDLPTTMGNPVIRVAEKMLIDQLPPGAYTVKLSAQDTANQFLKRTADFELQ